MKHSLTLLTLLLLPLTASRAGDDAPIIGAIRWDAWYGDGNIVNAVEASLGQPKYYFRLPWFARVINESTVSINGDSPSVIDQEIAYAAQVGLNYWAFLDYLNDAPSMSIALNPANAIIIYAWNEHDEGGWLSPTWSPDGNPNTARLDAIRSVLLHGKPIQKGRD